MTNSPAVWRRWLAIELRRLREERKMAQRQVGKVCGWSGAKLSYLENAQQTASVTDLARLLPLYGVPEDDWPTYYRAAERSRETGWWERYDSRVVPDWITVFVGLEQGAASIRTVDFFVPGLLQTPDYAAAMLATGVGRQAQRQVARQVDLRMSRQQVLIRGDEPLELTVLLEESALRRVAGDATTMVEQLDHLVRMAKRSNISLYVVPFLRGATRLLKCAFSVLTFPMSSDPGVVYIEHHGDAVYLEEEHEVERYTVVFEELRQSALSSQESIRLLSSVAEEYASRV